MTAAHYLEKGPRVEGNKTEILRKKSRWGRVGSTNSFITNLWLKTWSRGGDTATTRNPNLKREGRTELGLLREVRRGRQKNLASPATGKGNRWGHSNIGEGALEKKKRRSEEEM